MRRVRHRDAADEPGFWPWQDLYADALVGAGRVAEADAFLVPHEELAAARGRRSAIARLARARGRIEAAAGRPEAAERGLRRRAGRHRGLEVPFERARIELAAGGFLRRAGQRRRAAELLTAAERAVRPARCDALRRAVRAGDGRVRADAGRPARPGPARR